jgi:ABC-type antimicrobial peptide transport system permease subunit
MSRPPQQSPGIRPGAEQMNMPILYAMVSVLILAVLFPPWEAPPGRSPQFLGFHFVLSPPVFDVDGQSVYGVISRLLMTVELVTIAIAGLYFSWLFRKQA